MQGFVIQTKTKAAPTLQPSQILVYEFCTSLISASTAFYS